MAPHVLCSRGRVAPARHGSDRPQLAVAAWELNLSLTSSGALRDGPRAAPSEAPIPVVLAQRMRRLAYKLGPASEATSGSGGRHRPDVQPAKTRFIRAVPGRPSAAACQPARRARGAGAR